MDLLGKCTDGGSEIWNLADFRGDGSSTVQLSAYGVCLGIPNLPGTFPLLEFLSDADNNPSLGPSRCGKAARDHRHVRWCKDETLACRLIVRTHTRLFDWHVSERGGRVRLSSSRTPPYAQYSQPHTPTCRSYVNHSACGSTLTHVASPGDVVSASTNNGTARLAFDSDSEAPWVSAGGYDASGTPVAESPATTVSGSSVVGQWVQIALPAPVTVASYAIGFTSSAWPSSRRRPRAHVLLGATNATGPWTTIGRVDDGPFVPLETRVSFASMSMQAFSVYRLVVTRVHRMGDGAAEVGELVLVMDPQRFAIADATTSSAASVRWNVASIDPWSPVSVTIAQQRIATAFVTSSVYNRSVSNVARYAAAIAAMDVVTAAGTSTTVSATSIVNGSALNVPAGMPALGSGTWTLVLSAQFSAPSGFSKSLSVSRSSGSAALIVYDLTTDAATVLGVGTTASVQFVNGHVYNLLVVMTGGTSAPLVAGGVGSLIASVHSASLTRSNAITPTAFTPPKAPSYSVTRCANPYFSSMSF